MQFRQFPLSDSTVCCVQADELAVGLYLQDFGLREAHKVRERACRTRRTGLAVKQHIQRLGGDIVVFHLRVEVRYLRCQPQRLSAGHGFSLRAGHLFNDRQRLLRRIAQFLRDPPEGPLQFGDVLLLIAKVEYRQFDFYVVRPLERGLEQALADDYCRAEKRLRLVEIGDLRRRRYRLIVHIGTRRSPDVGLYGRCEAVVRRLFLRAGTYTLQVFLEYFRTACEVCITEQYLNLRAVFACGGHGIQHLPCRHGRDRRRACARVSTRNRFQPAHIHRKRRIIRRPDRLDDYLQGTFVPRCESGGLRGDTFRIGQVQHEGKHLFPRIAHEPPVACLLCRVRREGFDIRIHRLTGAAFLAQEPRKFEARPERRFGSGVC